MGPCEEVCLLRQPGVRLVAQPRMIEIWISDVTLTIIVSGMALFLGMPSGKRIYPAGDDPGDFSIIF